VGRSTRTAANIAVVNSADMAIEAALATIALRKKMHE
jgi:hypothetical protein